MRKSLIAALLFIGAILGVAAPAPVLAQSTAPVILPGGCGTANFQGLNTGYLTIDPEGRLCIQPNGSAITGNATGTTGAVVGTLAAVAGKTTYICGFDVSAIGGTAAVGPITVAGTLGSSMVYQLASSASGVTLSKTFTPCVPASAANTPITVTTTADASATAVSVNAWGYQQ